MASSSDVNFAIVSGRLSQNPHFYPAREDGVDDDKDRCWCVLASNPNTKKDVEANFININCFGKSARLLRQYGKKGKGWTVVGPIRTRREQLPDGTYKNYVEIAVMFHYFGADAGKGKNVPAVQTAPPAQEAPVSTPAPDPAGLAAIAAALAQMDASAVQKLVTGIQKQKVDEDVPF